MAELGSVSGRRGEAGGHGNGERWRRLRSGALGEERTREEGEREGGEKGPGRLRGDVRSIQSGAGRTGRQGGRRRGAVARARAGERRAHALVLLSEEGDDRRQRGWAGPPAGDGPGKWPR